MFLVPHRANERPHQALPVPVPLLWHTGKERHMVFGLETLIAIWADQTGELDGRSAHPSGTHRWAEMQFVIDHCHWITLTKKALSLQRFCGPNRLAIFGNAKNTMQKGQ